tara:strand:- start:2025 stop:2570 length:546 start_codon:yes stop_codon:yes gene_type:complete
MSRGLTAGQISRLEAKEPVFDLAIKLDKPSRSYTKYFTTGQFDLSLSGQTYLKDNGISDYTSIYGEDAKIQGTPFALTIQTTDTAFMSEFTTDSYKNLTTILVTLVFRDKASGYAPDTTDAIDLFSGLLDSSSVSTSSIGQSLTLNFSNPIGFGFRNKFGRKANSITKYSSQSLSKSFWRS